MGAILVILPSGVEKTDANIIRHCEEILQTEHLEIILILETVDDKAIEKFKEELTQKIEIDIPIETYEEDRVVQGLELLGVEKGDRVLVVTDEGHEEIRFDRNTFDI